MKVTVQNDRIDITEIPIFNSIAWDPILDELNAEPLPGTYMKGMRMGFSFTLHSQQIHAYIFRTNKMPSEQVIREILTKHGIG
jgi:hypothetical protein